MDVLPLLRSKNRCLQKFHDISVAFREQAMSGNLDELSQFENRREAALKAIELYDRKIAEAVSQLPAGDKDPDLVRAVRAALDEKENLIAGILRVDADIIRKIEEARDNLLNDLSTTRKSRDNVSKFKSAWMNESGEELDTQL